jgi:sugar/nucleoside kinase (ribokinase family)
MARHDDADADPGTPLDLGAPLDLVCFSLIVDDIVYWDGRTSMANVGGGGPQVLWGFAATAAALAPAAPPATSTLSFERHCSASDGDARWRPPAALPALPASIALAAGVGSDLPRSVLDWLSGPCLGADVSGLIPGGPASATPRAWQILERDGRRTQIWRVPETPALYEQLRPPFPSMPPRLRRRARSYHIGLHAAHPPRSLLRALREAVDAQGQEAAAAPGATAETQRQRRCLLSAETYTRCDEGSPLSARQLEELLAPLDVFSPNEEEAASMLGVRLRHGRGDDDGGEDDEEAEARAAEEAERLLLDALLDAASPPSSARGPLTITLRRGSRGVLAKTAGGGGDGAPARAVRVPAARDLRVVDPVGCGNAFCGGFLAAAHAGKGLAEACAYGCAAGGTMAEHRGVPRVAVAALAPAVARRARELAVRARAGPVAARRLVALRFV